MAERQKEPDMSKLSPDTIRILFKAYVVLGGTQVIIPKSTSKISGYITKKDETGTVKG